MTRTYIPEEVYRTTAKATDNDRAGAGAHMATEYEDYEALALAHAMGEPDAVRYVGQRLELVDKLAKEKANQPNELEQKSNELQRAAAVNKAWLEAQVRAAKKHPDVYLEGRDPEKAYLAGQLIGGFRTSRPELTFDEALDKAAEIADERLGDQQERDYAGAIAREKFFRQHGRKPPEGVALSSDDDVGSDAQLSEEDLDRSLAIAQMAVDRRGHVNQAAERERERRGKEAGRALAAMRASRGMSGGSEE